MIMVSGLNYGTRASLPHYFGICFGFPAMFFAVGFGLGIVFEEYPILHTLIKVFGTLYLLYLAWLIAISQPAAIDPQKHKPLRFYQAALFQWVNPKAWVMGTSAIAAFTTVGADMNAQIFVVWLVFVVTAIPAVGVWMLFGVGLQRVLHKPLLLRLFNSCMALLLVVSIWPIVADLVLTWTSS
jgi:threonine/homoserine/homoserine lactone efflux protein